MALYLVELPGKGGENRFDGIKAMIIEADDATVAKKLAAAQSEGDADWNGATTTAIAAGVASDYVGYKFRIRVGPTSGSDPSDLRDWSYTAVASDTIDLIGAALQNLIRGGPVAAGITDDGGAYTDDTAACNNDTASDINLLPATPASGDAFLLGFSLKFNRLVFVAGTQGTGTYTITWKYWDGDSWEALASVTDGSNNFKASGTSQITWTMPSDWAKSTINSQGPFFYVKAEVDGGTVTVVPLGTRIWLGEGQLGTYISGSNTLTVAAASDNIGDKTLLVECIPPGGKTHFDPLIGTITHQGSAGAALSVVLNDETAIPAVMKKL